MQKRSLFAFVSLPLLIAACGAPSTPVAVGPGKTDLVSLRLNLGLGSQGMPTGNGFSPAGAHLKVKVADSTGAAVTFNQGVYAPAGTGDTFLTLNAANGFGATVLLPKGQYTFETIAKDGPSEANTTGTLLAYSKTALTMVEAGSSNVRLSVHAVMSPADSSLDFKLPTSVVYTNDTLDLRLRVKTSPVSGTSFMVPTSDFSIGAYTVTHGTLDTRTASKLGVSLTATGLASDPTVTVMVPVTAWMRDGGAETASLQTMNVTFTHSVVSGVVSADVDAPSASISPASAVVNVAGTIQGTAQDLGGSVSAARVFDGTTLIASTDSSEQSSDVSALNFPNGDSNWSAAWTPGSEGDHALLLIVNDAVGNETRVEQTVTVAAAPVFTETAMSASTNGLTYTLQAGETRTFRTAPTLDVTSYGGYYRYVYQTIYEDGYWSGYSSDCYSNTAMQVSAVDAATGTPVNVPYTYGGCYAQTGGYSYYGSLNGEMAGTLPLVITVTNVGGQPLVIRPMLEEYTYY